MTQAAIGGPAQTTYRVTSRQGVIGRDAQRVFVVADGRPAEGGPQQAVYYVTDAEIAAGDFVISGNKPIPIVEVGPVGVEYPPIAVYVVTASSESDFPPTPEPPPADPIGDGLRADVAVSVKYNNGWIDPTGAHTWTPVNAPTSAASAYGDLVACTGTQYLTTPSDTVDLTPGNHDFTIVAAAKFNTLPGQSSGQTICIKDNVNGDDEYLLQLRDNSGAKFDFLIAGTGEWADIQADTFGTAQTNTLYLIFAWYESATQSIHIQIDNGAIDSFTLQSGPQTAIATPTTLDIGCDSAGGQAQPVTLLDGSVTIQFYKRLLNQTEKDYLWNSGAGRALYP